MWSGQEEIFDYLRGLADKYDLRRNIHFGRTMTGGYWDAERQRWHVHTESGDEYVAQFVVSGIGALHIPNVPHLPGADTFEGTVFHSAEWNHDYDLRGKKVAVIGTGASAVQFVPEIVGDVAELQLYQRTPPWVIPGLNFGIPPQARRLFGRVPLARRMVRAAVYWTYESLALGFNGHSRLMRPIESAARKNLNRTVTDPELRRKLTPVLSHRLQADPGVGRVLSGADLTEDGRARRGHRGGAPAQHRRGRRGGAGGGRDHLRHRIPCHRRLRQCRAHRVEGRRLADEWEEHGIRTYLGITVAGYPNAFFLFGPNTGLGHNSVVFMIESQIRYALELMDLVDRRGADSAAVRPAVQSRFNTDIQRKLAKGGVVHRRVRELVPGLARRQPHHLAGFDRALLAPDAVGRTGGLRVHTRLNGGGVTPSTRWLPQRSTPVIRAVAVPAAGDLQFRARGQVGIRPRASVRVRTRPCQTYRPLMGSKFPANWTCTVTAGRSPTTTSAEPR